MRVAIAHYSQVAIMYYAVYSNPESISRQDCVIMYPCNYVYTHALLKHAEWYFIVIAQDKYIFVITQRYHTNVSGL